MRLQVIEDDLLNNIDIMDLTSNDIEVIDLTSNDIEIIDLTCESNEESFNSLIDYYEMLQADYTIPSLSIPAFRDRTNETLPRDWDQDTTFERLQEQFSIISNETFILLLQTEENLRLREE